MAALYTYEISTKVKETQVGVLLERKDAKTANYFLVATGQYKGRLQSYLGGSSLHKKVAHLWTRSEIKPFKNLYFFFETNARIGLGEGSFGGGVGLTFGPLSLFAGKERVIFNAAQVGKVSFTPFFGGVKVESGRAFLLLEANTKERTANTYLWELPTIVNITAAVRF